jgi:hypothetical protein
MISAYFTCQQFVSIERLIEIENFNSASFTEIILRSFVQSVNLFRPKMQAQGYWMHIDNATRHNSALSLQKTEERTFTRLSQPLHSADLAPCDFFLFDYLKKELQWMNFIFLNGVISAVTAILSEIPVRTLSGVFDQWIERLHGCITNSGGYV